MLSIGRLVRPLTAALLLAAGLHAVGIARGRLPAQDGVKFLKVARDFQTRPWADVIRGTDRHPLYPALVAAVEPAVAAGIGRGPDAWRVAGQLVAATAAVLLLIPLHGLTRTLFDDRTADLAALGLVLLPIPMAVGHDTLSDSLGLAAFVFSLRLGLAALTAGRLSAGIGCGLAAGLGFLARPEVAVAPVAVIATGGVLALRGAGPARQALAHRLPAVGLAFLVTIGGYALVKGEVSEKLALRAAAGVGPSSPPRVAPRDGRGLPSGLDHPAWDFSPKEEEGVEPRSLPEVVAHVGGLWAEGLGWVLGLFVIRGLIRDLGVRQHRAQAEKTGRVLAAVYAGLFAAILVRHEWRLGYLSNRHLLTLVVLSLPWAAAGVLAFARRVGNLLPTDRPLGRLAGGTALVAAVVGSVCLQAKEPHPSRWGHLAAGRWVAANAAPGEALLDTRGWAGFVSGAPTYDYWHVRQALTDSRLRYVVVGDDELRADSPRGATLRALLAYASAPAAAFPSREGGDGVGVHVFRFRRPDSWEGLRP